MKPIEEYERPNCVSGLIAKAKELKTLRDKHVAEVDRLTVDLDHLEASIKLFDPTIKAHITGLFETKNKPRRGEVQRFILNTLRDAREPLSVRDMTKKWVRRKGIEAEPATFRVLRRKLGIAVTNASKSGLIECTGYAQDDETGCNSKLWGIK